MKRHWINAPSTLQPVHHMHGKNVIAEKTDDKMVTVYFVDGDTISARIPAIFLADGWRK